MEENIIEHSSHEHPLKLTENVGNEETNNLHCYGCKKPVTSEPAYICANDRCGSESIILHKKCGELPKQISHPSHSEHLLHIFHTEYVICKFCRIEFKNCAAYRCLSCDFTICTSCTQPLEEKSRIKHPSHHHVLTLIRKPNYLFCCDGCGSEGRDMAYTCSTCELMIHKTCALLPLDLPTNHHHHHLSLAFNFPFKHRRFEYKCEICCEDLYYVYWVYYCGDCKFFAHVKCATSSPSSLNSSEGSGADLIELPVDDILKELITPFIMRENGEIPDVDAMPSLIIPATEFNYHNHPLSLVRDEEESDDEVVVKICNACVSPISSPPYYKCTTSTCTSSYFLHSICYFLPKKLSHPAKELYGACEPTSENFKLFTASLETSLETSLKLILDYNFYDLPKNHTFTLYTASLETTVTCHLCKLETNGMVYKCEGECGECIDVKCASLPTTLKHSFHPQHKRLDFMRRKTHSRLTCSARGCKVYSWNAAYSCTTCDFELHLFCALLPRSVRDKRWDKNHSLVLTCKASLDHPTDFYCESCEKEMHPKEWIYHCRACDNSFHPHCLTASGWCRNIKFGHQLEIDHHFHPHPLTYNIVTLKLRCDICKEECYRHPGVECELCNYVACRPCALKHVKH